MNLLPLNVILLPLLILLIVVVLRNIMPIIRHKISTFVTWRRSFIVAGIYLGVLILIVPILYMLPNQGLSKLAENKTQTEMLSQNAISNLNNHLPLEGDLAKQPGLYRNSNYTFKVDTKKLAFNGSTNTNNQIFVERKDVDDGEIEVSTYAATHTVVNVDFTKLILPPVISYTKGMLSIKSANQQQLDFKQFNSDFTVAQFKNLTKGVGNAVSSGFGFGWKMIYIRVPKNLEIDKGKYDGQIQMLSS